MYQRAGRRIIRALWPVIAAAGIGCFTRRSTESFDPTKLFGLVAVVAAMAIIMNEIVRRAEVKFGRWRSN